MLVLATNRAEELDTAVLDRMDDSLLFPLPDKERREALLWQYFSQAVAPTSDRSWLRRPLSHKVHVGPGLTKQFVCGFADAVKGFSGREIAKLMLAIQNAALASADSALTPNMFETVARQKVEEHLQKERFGIS